MQLRFHKRIYTDAAVKKAVDAFAGIAAVGLGEDGDYITAEVEAVSPEPGEDVAGEFDNYVLGETISAMRGES
ncbi:MAG: hypothetical protein FJ087_12945 [Deltaproteobacteria bacterium]|nr:hypothetical protein [Deltaproteobacteria bacterium]